MPVTRMAEVADLLDSLGTIRVAPVAGARRSPDEVALGFVDALRGAGHPVGLGDAIVFVDALARVGMDVATSVYWSGRATLVKHVDDLASYDRVFAEYWLHASNAGSPSMVVAPPPVVMVAAGEDADEPDELDQPDDEEDGDERLEISRASAIEVLRTKDFARYDPEELSEIRRLMADLKLTTAARRSRRRRPARHPAAGRPDLRRTLHAAARQGGEVVQPLSTVRTTRPRRVVLLCDISGSMEPYARAVLRFAQVAAAGGRRRSADRAPVEVFTFGTRLTRVTRELAHRDPDDALAAAAGAVDDWSGGTRLGASLRRFNDDWGVRGMARGAVVVIVSDGWERGDPSMLAEEMARLARVAHRIVWVNPLKASPGYEPLARGMAAALPFVDRFVEGHSLDALDALVAEIAS